MQGKVPVEARAFARIWVNLSHSEARFDSRSEPLFRLFHLLPVTMASLERLCEDGDPDDVKHASTLLARFGGTGGYDRTVSAVVVRDDVVMSGKFSDQCKAWLRPLLRDGAIWLPEAAARETMDHQTCLPVRRPAPSPA